MPKQSAKYQALANARSMLSLNVLQNLYIRRKNKVLGVSSLISKIEIDELDQKILSILIKDARTRLKDIAKQCGTSSVSVLKRIKRLKSLKVITGATLFINAEALGFPILATLGMKFNGNQDAEIETLLTQQTNLVELASSIGEYDFSALVYAESLTQLDEMTYAIREHFGAREITVHVWSYPPQMLLENLDLKPQGH
jgi:DNA-binding Lrp family transcriptional regulator